MSTRGARTRFAVLLHPEDDPAHREALLRATREAAESGEEEQ